MSKQIIVGTPLVKRFIDTVSHAEQDAVHDKLKGVFQDMTNTEVLGYLLMYLSVTLSNAPAHLQQTLVDLVSHIHMVEPPTDS